MVVFSQHTKEVIGMTKTHRKLCSEAADNGLWLIGEGKSSLYRKYKFITCGHIQDIATGHVRKGKFVCKQCNPSNDIHDEATKRGLMIVGPGRSCDYRTYKFKKCDHEQEITVSAVRQGSFICRTCENNRYSKPTIVYVVKLTAVSGFSWVKIGYAIDVNVRLSKYGTCPSTRAVILREFICHDGHRALQLEKSLNNMVIQYHIPSNTMKKYMHSGFTECFTCGSLDVLPLDGRE